MNHQEVQGHWPGSCFGCSATNPQGLKLSFRHTEQGCSTSCTVPGNLCGFDGLVHGGIIATLLDEVSGWAIFSHLGRLGVTREMTTRYQKPVPINTELIIEGRIVSHDERTAVVRATIHSTDGMLLAEGDSAWAFPRLSRMANLAGIEEGTLQQFLDSCCRK